MLISEILKAIIIGAVEGITEWLPISSTGHLILLDEILSLNVSASFFEMLLVVIQLGAISAVPVLFLKRLWPLSTNDGTERRKKLILWSKVLLGAFPAALLGLLFDDLLDRYFYNFIVVALALIIYGIAFIFAEKSRAESDFKIKSLDDMSFTDALKIGAFQCLSLIPGTSRSGSTILGGMLLGVSRTAGAEFSFFMAIPIMIGASGLKIIKFIFEVYVATAEELLLLFVGVVTSFLVSIFVIRFLMDYVRRHDFKIFGYYRIALGAILLAYFIIVSFA